MSHHIEAICSKPPGQMIKRALSLNIDLDCLQNFDIINLNCLSDVLHHASYILNGFANQPRFTDSSALMTPGSKALEQIICFIDSYEAEVLDILRWATPSDDYEANIKVKALIQQAVFVDELSNIPNFLEQAKAFETKKN